MSRHDNWHSDEVCNSHSDKPRILLIQHIAYPDSFDGEAEPDFFGATETKISRPLSEPGSPRDRSGMMTPGDFASLQEGLEGLSTEDYIAWKLPSVHFDSHIQLAWLLISEQ
jgi:hypothetical protein